MGKDLCPSLWIFSSIRIRFCILGSGQFDFLYYITERYNKVTLNSNSSFPLKHRQREGRVCFAACGKSM